MTGNAVRAAEHSQNCTHVSGVAVRIPAAHGGNFHRAGKIPFTVVQTQGTYAGIGDDMTYAGVAVIAPPGLQHGKAGPPVTGMGMVKISDCVEYLPVQAVFGNPGKTRGNHRFHCGHTECRGDGGGHERSAVQPFAVVGYAGRGDGHPCREIGIIRRDQAPGIYKNLPADLLRQGFPVLADGAAFRRRYAAFQIQVRRMLGADAVPAPPVQPHAFPGIIEPCFGYIPGSGQTAVAPIIHGPKEKDRPVGVVVGGKMTVLFHVIPDLTIVFPDTFAAPEGRLHRGSQTDADIHAQNDDARLDVPFRFGSIR